MTLFGMIAAVEHPWTVMFNRGEGGAGGGGSTVSITMTLIFPISLEAPMIIINLCKITRWSQVLKYLY